MTDLPSFIEQKRLNRLAAYRNEPGDIREHAGIEETVLAGGYGYRQVLELVQNGADAILEASEQTEGFQQKARIEVVLYERYLYVANTGAPLTQDGVEALLQSHSSPKRGNQIGRFGLGFKSLLRLGGKVDIFSTSGSLRFDPQACRNEIRKEFGLDESLVVPGLRLAWTLNREEAESGDDTLAGFPWATTIVRAEIVNADIQPHLREEIQNFPSQFLLFLPVAVALDLDAGDGAKRYLRREPDGQEIILHDGDANSRWRVVENLEVHITDLSAKADATHLHAREVVPLAWAMPLDVSREEAGRFWAFFPTNTPTRLAGILNAPWKLNSDRNALIPGDWNTALMKKAAELVAETLPGLATEADPGRPLDAFPRQLDRLDEPAAPLISAIWDQVRTASVVPDALGVLRRGYALSRPPLDDQALNEQWCDLAQPEAKERWVHSSCLGGQRPSRLDEFARHLAQRSSSESTLEKIQRIRTEGTSFSLKRAGAAEWFNSIASGDLATAKNVLRVAEGYAGKRDQWQWGQDRQSLAIIPSDSGQLSTPGELVIAPAGISIPGREAVSRALVDDPETCRILTEILKVKRLDDEGWLGLLNEALNQANRREQYVDPRSNDRAWRHFWDTLRLSPDNLRKNFVDDHRNELRVRRRDGAWVLYDEVLMPGAIVSVDSPEESNRGILVDEDTHANDGALLKSLNVRDNPCGTPGSTSYEAAIGDSQNLLNSWLKGVEGDYRGQLDANRNPQSHYLRPLSMAMPNGWMLLAQLKGLANTRLTMRFLSDFASLEAMVDFGHTTQGKYYQPTQVAHPVRWFIRRYGTLAIGRHAIPLETVLARRNTPALAKVQGWDAIVPKLEQLDNLVGAPALPKPTDQQIKNLWRALFDHLATPEAITDDSLEILWTSAAKDGEVPAALPSSGDNISLVQVYVTGSSSLAGRARGHGLLAVTLDAETRKLWLEKGACNLDEQYRAEWDEILAASALLETAVPELSEVLTDEARRTALCQSVSGLHLVIADEKQTISCIQWEGVLRLDPERLECLSRVDRLTAILDEVAAAGWLSCSFQHAQKKIADAQVDTNRARVKAGAGLPERLLEAVGGRPEPLLDALGEAARRNVPQHCAPIELARLCLAMLGPIVLQELRQVLENEGLQPPVRWGGDEARAFVAAIGFPEEFASAPESKREAEEIISGPIHLPDLHDYQEEVVKELRKLIASGKGRRRAVVSLPTGGGKTRVTVQAAVDIVLKPESDKRTVLWVAQTDELCEQAVQAFRQVWMNRGCERTDLRVIRFWGGHRNPSSSGNNDPTVLVASIQTLNSRIGQEGLEWLSNPGLVVVDECHHAITKSYTGILRWLDAEAPRPGSQAKDEPPIFGLSATPFRAGNDGEESIRLARRFDRTWLPSEQEDLHRRLTKQGILANAEYIPLKSPTVLIAELAERIETEHEADGTQLENLLNAINEFLATNEDRNRLLVETIKSSPERSILLFANSVSHAEEMAMRLNLERIPAAAISGDTPSSARRYFLDRFKRQEIRVLCNYNVLTTGFDAPKTDMVLIARQVQSPVRYMQMVGRGLRGEKNGGTEVCRIVTVMDNLGRFSDRHPFHYCAKYFSAPSPRVASLSPC
ncbi:MAG: DEAD/DEAH box helicase family protein [Rhodocyclaceae bacterium]|nr:DEAD/DEAH box helicase family protein [Rhodocyclaceae bacterium]